MQTQIKVHLPEGLEIGTFVPCSYHDVHMDDIELITRDACTINGGRGNTCFEAFYATDRTLISFRLLGAKHLQKPSETKSLARLLARAFRVDVGGKELDLFSKLAISTLYLRAAVLLAAHPGTWRLQ